MRFPEIFENKDFHYPPGTEQPQTALSDALVGWGSCTGGTNPPKNFGKGMCMIGLILGINPTPENIDKMADKLIAKGD